jgi:hypothetical protein
MGNTKKKKNQLRDTISATGSYISLPEAFPTADPAIRNMPKIELRVERFAGSKKPLHFEPVMYPHTILVDLEAVDHEAFDAATLALDCELLAAAARKHPKELRQILAAFAPSAPHGKMLRAFALTQKLGLDEKSATRSGGGLIWLLAIVAAALLSGCKSCAHTNGATRQGGTTPARR